MGARQGKSKKERARAEQDAVRARRAETGAVLRFLVTFGALAILFELAFIGWIADSAWMDHHLALNAWGAGGLLRLLGFEVLHSGTLISGPGGAITVAIGCDGIQPVALYAFAVIAFPVAWRSRLLGLLAGLPLLLGLNLVRIATLYYVVTDHRESFEDVHLTVWPMIFIVCALAMWLGWVRFALPAPPSSA